MLIGRKPASIVAGDLKRGEIPRTTTVSHL
jgi:hypothetical protein